jgi:hypothetical protein
MRCGHARRAPVRAWLALAVGVGCVVKVWWLLDGPGMRATQVAVTAVAAVTVWACWRLRGSP